MTHVMYVNIFQMFRDFGFRFPYSCPLRRNVSPVRFLIITFHVTITIGAGVYRFATRTRVCSRPGVSTNNLVNGSRHAPYNNKTNRGLGGAGRTFAFPLLLDDRNGVPLFRSFSNNSTTSTEKTSQRQRPGEGHTRPRAPKPFGFCPTRVSPLPADFLPTLQNKNRRRERASEQYSRVSRREMVRAVGRSLRRYEHETKNTDREHRTNERPDQTATTKNRSATRTHAETAAVPPTDRNRNSRRGSDIGGVAPTTTTTYDDYGGGGGVYHVHVRPISCLFSGRPRDGTKTRGNVRAPSRGGHVRDFYCSRTIRRVVFPV